MGKNKQTRQQLVLEEYQDPVPEVTGTIETHRDTDTEEDFGSLPGCLGFHQQPEPGFVCSSCYHQTLCRATTPTATIIVNKS